MWWSLIRNLAFLVIPLVALMALKYGWTANVALLLGSELVAQRAAGLTDYITRTPWVLELVEALIGGFAITIVLGVFLKWDEIKRVDSAITRTLVAIYGGAEREIFSQLPDAEKQRIVRKSVVNILGDEYGSVLFDEILAPYLDREINYRDNFQYSIVCRDALPIATGKATSTDSAKEFISLTKGEFIWVSQSLAYTRSSATDDKEIPHLYARFTFSQDQLNQFIVTDELFFREIIRVPESVRNLLYNMNERHIGEFFREILGFRVFSADGLTALNYSTHWIEDHSTREKFIEFRIDNPSNAYRGSGCRLEFTLPHHKTEKEFLVTIPVPTKSGAEISFTRSPSMRMLSYIPFFSSFRQQNYEAVPSTLTPGDINGPETIKLHLTGWSFPTSGMVFVWK